MKPITVAVNTRMLLANRLDGTGWFAYQTLRRLARAHPAVNFIFIFDRPYSAEFIFSANVTARVIWPPARHPFLYYLWYQVTVKRFLNRLKPDLFLSPDGLLPLGVSCPTLAVIHDINFRHYPKDLPGLTSRYFNHYYPRSIDSATRLIAVSEYTKNDIVKEYGADPNKIDIVYNGVNDAFGPTAPATQKKIKDEYTAGADFFLFVGSVHPRKNIPRLLQAFEKFKTETASPLKLVIAGSYFWGRAEIEKLLNTLKFKSEIIFTGRVPDADLPLLTSAATALTYVPYFEGFGVPLLEAMRSEIPIIAANTTSLPEVAGAAALYVDPFDVEQIKTALRAITTDFELRRQLVAAGRIQAQKFSWDASAERLWQSIERAIA